jgi:hypothetical protein
MQEYDLLSILGAACFGIVIGWITYRSLRFSTSKGLGDIATVIGAVGGAAVTGIFPSRTGAFGAYCVGLFVGFFGYLRAAKDPAAPPWMGGTLRPPAEDTHSGTGGLPPITRGAARQPPGNPQSCESGLPPIAR